MKTRTEILDGALVNIEAVQYRVTIDCSYSDTLRIHTKILEAAAFLKNAIKETKGDDRDSQSRRCALCKPDGWHSWLLLRSFLRGFFLHASFYLGFVRLSRCLPFFLLVRS